MGSGTLLSGLPKGMGTDKIICISSSLLSHTTNPE